METEVKWYRVIDPLSPLYGCDVRGWKKNIGSNDLSYDEMLVVCAMRRIDVFVGDRPFQLIAPEGENLGLLIVLQCLEPSPLQDDVVELTTDIPYGEFLEEVEVSRDDGCVLHIVAFERAFQVALLVPSIIKNADRRVAVSRVIDCSPEMIKSIRDEFDLGCDAFDIKRTIERISVLSILESV